MFHMRPVITSMKWHKDSAGEYAAGVLRDFSPHLHLKHKLFLKSIPGVPFVVHQAFFFLLPPHIVGSRSKLKGQEVSQCALHYFLAPLPFTPWLSPNSVQLLYTSSQEFGHACFFFTFPTFYTVDTEDVKYLTTICGLMWQEEKMLKTLCYTFHMKGGF